MPGFFLFLHNSWERTRVRKAYEVNFIIIQVLEKNKTNHSNTRIWLLSAIMEKTRIP
jgi:hypothetical protein